jgi:hypothetical protein
VEPYIPIPMIDKSAPELKAIQRLRLALGLCGFHGNRAYAGHVRAQPGVSMFIGPIMTAFKAVAVASTLVR